MYIQITMLFYLKIVDQARDMEVAIKNELPGTVHPYSVAPMIRSAAAVALSPQRGCSSSTCTCFSKYIYFFKYYYIHKNYSELL